MTHSLRAEAGPGKAIQDQYPDDLAHCYGCGRLNEHGLHVRTILDGEETVAIITPRPWHTAIPGYVYGGLIASLVDCHGTGTAALVSARTAGADAGSPPRFVTAALKVDYLKPTPLGPPIEARGRVIEQKPKKVIVAVTVSVEGEVCARGEVVAVRMPESMIRPGDTAKTT